MTFNIQHGTGIDRRLDLGRQAKLIRASGVDLVGLQEVDRHYGTRSGFVDEAGWLGSALGMQVVYGANVDLDPPAPGRPRRQYGNALLCAGTVLDQENIPLPGAEGHEQRGLLRARVDVRGTAWQAYVTHLQHDDPAARLAQSRAIAAQLAGAPRTVLTGDLNAQPGSPELDPLTEVLVDAWGAAGTGCGQTAPNPIPYRRIDYVFHSPDVSTRHATVIRTFAARIASDHLPVVVELSGDV
jgi:endonuclease/exonuclease/phosphatase family metal-dependent hydrolase